MTFSTMYLTVALCIMAFVISIKYYYAECCCAMRFIQCYAEYNFAECHYAQCRYAEYRNAKGCGAIFDNLGQYCFILVNLSLS